MEKCHFIKRNPIRVSSQVFIVDKIVDKIKSGTCLLAYLDYDGVVYYEVKWQGGKETSWEPETNEDILRIVRSQ